MTRSMGGGGRTSATRGERGGEAIGKPVELGVGQAPVKAGVRAGQDESRHPGESLDAALEKAVDGEGGKLRSDRHSGFIKAMPRAARHLDSTHLWTSREKMGKPFAVILSIPAGRPSPALLAEAEY